MKAVLSRVLIMLTLAFWSGVGCSNAHGEEKSRVFYVPIGSRTYADVSVRNIEERYSHFAELEPTDQRLSQVFAILDNAEDGSFQDGIGRVMISRGSGHSIYIDNAGGVKTPEGESVLTATDLQTVKSLLESAVVARSN